MHFPPPYESLTTQEIQQCCRSFICRISQKTPRHFSVRHTHTVIHKTAQTHTYSFINPRTLSHHVDTDCVTKNRTIVISARRSTANHLLYTPQPLEFQFLWRFPGEFLPAEMAIAGRLFVDRLAQMEFAVWGDRDRHQ